MGRSGRSGRSGSFALSLAVVASVVLASDRAAAESFLLGALELDETNAIAWQTLATNRTLLGDGRVFEVRGDEVGCALTRSASVGGPLPASRSARFVGATLVTPRGPWAGTSALVFGLSGSTFNAASLDCESGLGPTRTIALPPNRGLDLSPPVHRYLLADGSVLAVAHGTGSDLDETRYSTLVRLVPGETSWTGTDVFSSRALRSLIDPSLLATFDRNLYQHLRIDDFAITPDGNVWMAVRQLDSRSVRGTWLIRWRPEAGWSGAAFDVIATFGPGMRLAATIEWVPALGIVVMDGHVYVDPTSLVPTIDVLAEPMPTLVPAFDESLWGRGTPTTPTTFDGLLAPLRFLPEVADLDSDTLTHAEEVALGSSDVRLDSDYDGVRDVLERHVFGTNAADGDSRPEHVDVGFVPRFGVSTRLHTSTFAGANARLTYESAWTSSPYLCSSGQCIDGTGVLRTLMRPGAPVGEPPDEVSAMTADGSAWLGKPRDGAGVRFFDGTTIDARVFELFALDGQLGATDQGFVTPAGMTPYTLTLPDREAPLVHPHPARLLGVDDTTNEALVSIDDVRGQLVLRLDESGEARVLFRPDWLDLGRVETMTWLTEHDLYLVRSRDGVTGPAIYTFLDRAMRAVGRIGAPLSGENYRVGRFFGRGYALHGPGPDYTVGGYYTWFLAELVEHMSGLTPGDALLWSAAYGLGLWVYREDGTAFPLATAAELRALADEDAREALPGLGPDTLESVDVMQLDVAERATEACFATTSGTVFVVRFVDGVPTRLSLVAAADTFGCTYDGDGELHTLRVVGGLMSVRDSNGVEVAAGGVQGVAQGLFHARDAAGNDVWVVDFIGPTIDDTSSSACLRAGEGLVVTGFDAAGVTVQRVGEGPDVVAWIDAVLDSNNGTLGSVQAALVDDFCRGLSAERAHSTERPGPRNLFHQAYEHVIGGMPGTGAPDITVNEAAFALRPDGRYVFASRNLRSRAGGLGNSGMMLQEAGAWHVTGGGTRIAAHDGWRRSAASGLALAIAQRGVRAMDVVPGEVHAEWGSTLDMQPGPVDRPEPPDAGVSPDASSDGGEGEGATEPAGCACRAASSRPADVMGWATLAVAASLVNRRGRSKNLSRSSPR